jgi:hypothetical protein
MVVIPPQFDTPMDFEHALAKIEVKSCIGYIDPQGHYVWKPRKENVLQPQHPGLQIAA